MAPVNREPYGPPISARRYFAYIALALAAVVAVAVIALVFVDDGQRGCACANQTQSPVAQCCDVR